jgi:hypothetical protein
MIKFNLSPKQYEPISEFCLDIAKGLILAVFVGQNFVKGIAGLPRLIVSLSWTVMAFLFLIFAVLFKDREVVNQ